MAFYGMSDRQILDLPVTRFWLMSRSIDRISAERDMRMAMVVGAVQSVEGTEELFKRLQDEMGKVVVFNESMKAELKEKQAAAQVFDLDRDGLDGLRGMGRVI